MRLAITLAVLASGVAVIALAAELVSPQEDDALDGRAADDYALFLAEASEALRQDVATSAAALSDRFDEPAVRMAALSRLGFDARRAHDIAASAKTLLPSDHPARKHLADGNRRTSTAARSLHRFAESRDEHLLPHARTGLSRAERDLSRAGVETA